MENKGRNASKGMEIQFPGISVKMRETWLEV